MVLPPSSRWTRLANQAELIWGDSASGLRLVTWQGPQPAVERDGPEVLDVLGLARRLPEVVVVVARYVVNNRVEDGASSAESQTGKTAEDRGRVLVGRQSHVQDVAGQDQRRGPRLLLGELAHGFYEPDQ